MLRPDRSHCRKSFEQIFWRVLIGFESPFVLVRSSFGDNFPGGCLQKDCLASGSQFAREILESPCYAVKMNAKAACKQITEQSQPLTITFGKAARRFGSGETRPSR